MGDGSLSSEVAERIRVEGKDTFGTHATHTVLLECNQGTRRVVVLFMVNPECQEIFFLPPFPFPIYMKYNNENNERKKKKGCI